jgi:hypothetical protein
MKLNIQISVLLSIALFSGIQAVPTPTNATQVESNETDTSVSKASMGSVLKAVGASAITVAAVAAVYALLSENKPCTIEDALETVGKIYKYTKHEKGYQLSKLVDLSSLVDGDDIQVEAFYTLSMLEKLQRAQGGYLTAKQILENPLFVDPSQGETAKYQGEFFKRLVACQNSYHQQLLDC